MNVPEELRYTSEHEWVGVAGNRARVGITDYAQDALGDVVYVALPEAGSTVEAMGSCCEVESTKSVSEVFAPVAGQVVEVNTELVDAPQAVNEDPYGKGWMFTIEMSEPSQVEQLLDAARYRKLLDQE